MQLTIPQAAKLYQKHRSTLHRHIERGVISCGVRGDGVRVVDLSELIRAYGESKNKPPELQPNATATAPAPATDLQQAMLHELQAMRLELIQLREEVAGLKRLPAPERTEAPKSPGKTVSSFADLLSKHFRNLEK
jgi:hypothetical protein